jgi:predicted amidohydrolase
MTLRIALAQIWVEGGRPQANLGRAVANIEQAAAHGADIVVLPECLDVGWTHPGARELAQPVPGAYSERLSQAAVTHQIFVVAGLVERAGEKLYNAAVLIDPQGEIRLLHRKINELDIAHDLYATGDRLGVVATELGVIGVNICADNAPDSLAIGHVLARMGAQIILSPSAWAVPAGHDNRVEPYGALWRQAYGELARLYDLPVIGVSHVGRLTAGPWQGWQVIGCSLAMSGRGEILAQGPYGATAEALLVVEVALREQSASGTRLGDELRRRGYFGP